MKIELYISQYDFEKLQVSKALKGYLNVEAQEKILEANGWYCGGGFEDAYTFCSGSCHGYPDLYNKPARNYKVIHQILNNQAVLLDYAFQSAYWGTCPEVKNNYYYCGSNVKRITKMDQWKNLYLKARTNESQLVIGKSLQEQRTFADYDEEDNVIDIAKVVKANQKAHQQIDQIFQQNNLKRDLVLNV